MADESYYKIIRGGISGGPSRYIGGLKGLKSGTLGAIVLDNTTHAPMVLSNYHVLCINEGWTTDKGVTQPYLGAASNHRIAEITRGFFDDEVDAVVARLLDDVHYFSHIEEIGSLTGMTTPEPNMHVRKRGRESGLTEGSIHSVQSPVNIPAEDGRNAFQMVNMICIRKSGFGVQGDSGAVLVDDRGRAVGLFFAVDGDGYSYAIPIDRVLRKMQVRMALQGIGGYDLTSVADRAFAFDTKRTGALDGLVLYRPGKGSIFLVQRNGLVQTYPDIDQNNRNQMRPGIYTIPMFDAVYKRPEGSYGISGYDLRDGDGRDQVFAFDYEGSAAVGEKKGKLDDLVLYRPGKGAIFILQRTGTDNGTPTFTPAYAQGEYGAGIGGRDLTVKGDPKPRISYDLRDSSGRDRVFAFDYEGDGYLNDLVLYRPGARAIFILQRHGFESEKDGKKTTTPAFDIVYKETPGGAGIGGFSLASEHDQIFAFDYEGDSKLNDLVVYGPGRGVFAILQRDGMERNKDGQEVPKFKPVYGNLEKSSDVSWFASEKERVFAFDGEGDGKLNDLVFYRPGSGYITILQREMDEEEKKDTPPMFIPIYFGTTGIGGYNLASQDDQMFAYDYEGDGKLNDLVLYRPGAGALTILQRDGVEKNSDKTRDTRTAKFKAVYVTSSRVG